MRGAVVGVEGDGTARHALGEVGMSGPQVPAAEQDVGRAVVRVEPDRALQDGQRRLPLVQARQRVAELREGHRVERIQRQLALGQRDRLFETAAKQRFLPEEVMGLHHRRVPGHGRTQRLLGHLVHVQPCHQLSGRHEGLGPILVETQRQGQRSPCRVGLPGVHGCLREDVRHLRRPPSLHGGLEVGQGLDGPAREHQRQTEHFGGVLTFGSFGQPRARALEQRDGARRIAEVVVGEPAHMQVPRVLAAGPEAIEQVERRLRTAGIDQAACLLDRIGRRGRLCVCDTAAQREAQEGRADQRRHARTRWPGQRRGAVPEPSRSVSNLLAATSCHCSSRPFGQRTSMRSTRAWLPRPTCTRKSFCE